MKDGSRDQRKVPAQEPPQPQPVRRIGSDHEGLQALNRIRAAAASKVTGGLSPMALALAGIDWWMHLAASPGKQVALAESAARQTSRLWTQPATTTGRTDAQPCIEPLPGKFHYLADTDVTFVLTSRGHNAGIVSEPGRPRRRYRVGLQRTHDSVLGPEDWIEEAESRDGSWWPEWIGWLEEQSSPGQVAPPATGSAEHPPLMDAPGSYIMVR